MMRSTCLRDGLIEEVEKKKNFMIGFALARIGRRSASSPRNSLRKL